MCSRKFAEPVPRTIRDQQLFLLAVASGISNGFQMVFKWFRIPMGASYEYAEEVHPTGFVGSDAASRRAAARDAEGGGAGADVGGGSGASRSMCIDGVLVSGFTGAYDDVAFPLLVKQPRPFFLPLFTEVPRSYLING